MSFLCGRIGIFFENGNGGGSLLFFVIEFARRIVVAFLECLIFFSDQSREFLLEDAQMFVGNDNGLGAVFDRGGRFVDEIEDLVREEAVMDMPDSRIERKRYDFIRKNYFMECFESMFGSQEYVERFIA